MIKKNTIVCSVLIGPFTKNFPLPQEIVFMVKKFHSVLSFKFPQYKLSYFMELYNFLSLLLSNISIFK